MCAGDMIGPREERRSQVHTFFLLKYFTKWAEAESFTKIEVPHLIRFIMRNIFARFGLPKAFVSDNGPKFKSTQMATFCKRFRVEHYLSSPSPYYPQGNGQAGASNKTNIRIVSKTVEWRTGGDRLDSLKKEKKDSAKFHLVYLVQMVFAVYHQRNFLNLISSHRRQDVRLLIQRESQLWNLSSRSWFHISYFKYFVMLKVPHVIMFEILSSAKFPGKKQSEWGKSTHGITLSVFVRLKSWVSVSHYMMFLLPYFHLFT